MPIAAPNPIELARNYVCDTDVSVFLTGKAVTGKTTFLRNLVATLHKRFVVVAPTGVAAINAGGVTIHSFFQLPLCPYLPDVPELVTEYQMPKHHQQLRKSKINIIRTLDLLIIDEISMVRADLLDAIDHTLRRYRRSQRPFGGVQLLLIGDVQQLPPVVTDEEKPYMDRVYPSPFFFHSKALQRVNYLVIQLTHIFRQQDARFISILNNIRDNRFDADTLRALNQRYIPNFKPDGSYIRLTTHNYQADRVNQAKLADLDSREVVYKATIEDNFPSSSFPTDEVLRLKVGAQVMFIRNDPEGNFFNGKIGHVTALSDDVITVSTSDNDVMEVSRVTWENYRYEIDPNDKQIKQQVDGTFSQFPLRLAWAVTIHKAQGLTFDHVIIDAAAAFSYGQVYVALSRCRRLEGLVLSSPITSDGAIDNNDVFQYVDSYPSIDKVQQGYEASRIQYFYNSLFELFDCSALLHAVSRIERIFYEKLRSEYRVKGQKITEISSQQLSPLVAVADKFRLQLVHLSQTMAPTDDYLAQRIAKAVDYFLPQLEQVHKALQPLLKLEVVNKAVSAELATAVDEYMELMRVKARCLVYVKTNGFSVDGYLAAKTDTLLDNLSDNGKKTKTKAKDKSKASKPKPPKEPKTPSWQISVQQFIDGMSVSQIAEARSFVASTIESHLFKGIEADLLDIGFFLTAQQYDELISFFLKHPDVTLSDANEHFQSRYTFFQLRIAHFKARRLLADA